MLKVREIAGKYTMLGLQPEFALVAVCRDLRDW